MIVAATSRDAGPVDEVDRVGSVEDDEIGTRLPVATMPMSTRRSAVAPPAVAAQIASSMVMFMSRTARAMQNGIDVV